MNYESVGAFLETSFIRMPLHKKRDEIALELQDLFCESSEITEMIHYDLFSNV
ncbi:hypothetical protein GTW56_09685 [Bacillus sp. EB93]|uniref:hypothetical protein n=1 Tax=Peribacillus TaxID=2675229 RepID=UPI00137B64E4|nr:MULTISPECIES: hypothetical protein [Peribacillus]MCT1390546.1 hypothetical protein [Peribacillus frigoritolerans]NCT36634.1 hypothetical protein [Peribacillus frigoritolerans]